jgi:hypothetical protein
MLLHGLLPLVLFYCLVWRRQFQPLVTFFIAVAFTHFAPVWWAMIDLFQRLAGSLAPQADDPILGLLGNGLARYTWSMMATAIGIPVVIVVTGAILFASFRSLAQVGGAGGR